MNWLPTLIKACYFLAALLFILGLKRMSSPRTARGGIVWAGIGMLLAVLATFVLPGLEHRGLILAAVLLGAGNAAGGYVVTERMLEMFKPSGKKPEGKT